MREMWNQAAVIGMLTICAAEDIRKKQIRLNVVLAFGIAGIVFHMLWQMQTIENILLGMGVGGALLLLGLFTGGKIGAGDGVLMIDTGIYLGMEQNVELLVSSLFICAIYALCLLVLRKKRRTDTVAFIPFVLVSYVCMLAGVI